jgi:nitroreductase
MNVKEAILTRRSIRKYKPEPVKEKDLKVILEAARQAPSAGNKQPWEFVIVKDQETKTKLAEIARKQMWIADAGVVVVALSKDKNDPGVYERWVERDVMTAVEHMVLQAWELGYGTCWIGAFTQPETKELLEIPEAMRVICLLPIGVPDQAPPAKPRREEKEIFHLNKYGNQL